MHTIDPLFDWFLSATLRGSVLILAVLLVQIAFGRRLPARWRHALWLPVLFVLGSPVLPESPLSVENGWDAPVPVAISAALDTVAAGTGTAIPPMEAAPVATPVRWGIVAGWAWLTGAIAFFLVSVIGCRRALVGFRRDSRPVSEALHGEVLEAAQACGLRWTPGILLSRQVPGPAMTGVFRPLLLLPASFEEAFDREERRLILLHECLHVKRGDLVVNGLLVLLQALHWCNPVVWIAFVRFRSDREIACDSAVLSMNREETRSRYGHALLKVESAAGAVAWRLGFVGLVGIVGRGRHLASRIAAIAGHRPAHPLWNLAGIGLILAIGLAGGTRAQEKTAAGGQQIVIETMFIEVPADAPIKIESESITHDAEKGLSVFSGGAGEIEQIAATPGADVLSAPSVVTLSGQKATVEIGTFQPDAVGKPRFVGTRFEILPTSGEGKIHLVMEAKRTQQITEDGTTLFLDREIKADSTIAPGNTLVVNLLDAKAERKGVPAKRLVIAMRARLADGGDLVRERLGKIIIPSIELNGARLTDALAFLSHRISELDPDQKGINLVYVPAASVPEPVLTVSFKDIPSSEALKYFAALSQLEIAYDESAVVLRKPSEAPADQSSPRTGPPSRSAAVAAKVVLPHAEFANTPLTFAIEFLQKKSIELDPEKKGLNLVINAPGEPVPADVKITLDLRNVPLSEALRYVAELAGLKLRYDEDAVVLTR